MVIGSQGEKRLVLNLLCLNQFLLKEKFKYEDFSLTLLLFKKVDYRFTFHFKLGYHHVDIHEKHWTYSRFEWQADTRSQYCVFTMLPFGLATASYIITELLCQLVRYW